MADLTGMMQAAAGAAGGDDNLFIEDVFSCFLYTGNGSTQTITNDIDIDGEGGLVWIKSRSAATDHQLFDTERGATKELISNSTAAEAVDADTLTGFNANGFALGADSNVNTSAATYVSWTFRKAPKFFDVVTYTGTGANRTVAHNLGSVPGSIWVKRTDTTGDWQVYHRANTANPETDFLVLNSNAATVDSNTRWNDTLPTDTVFTVGTEATVNASGGTYVAYLFAHDDGGFGDDGTENVITCGSYTGNGSATGPVVTLGYEPQWVLIKRASGSTAPWILVDTMRGMPVGSADPFLSPDGAQAEDVADNFIAPTSTGFRIEGNLYFANTNGSNYIFIAIRRGPMKTPTAGTEVFDVNYGNNLVGAGTIINSSTLVDMFIHKGWFSGTSGFTQDRLRGPPKFLSTATTDAEGTVNQWRLDQNTGVGYTVSRDLTGRIAWMFSRAPGYFDEVCYTGTGSATTFAHNLGVVPELMIMKKRSATDDWAVYAGDNTDFLQLNTTAATADDNTYWNDTSPTSSVFSVGTNADVNTSAATYVAYLFASLAGVQDIGTYTGNGTSLTVTTGFQPRFIMVKRTDSTGNWIVGDSTRGLVAGDDPALFLNTDTAETTNQDWVDVSATGFTVNETALNANVSTGVYLYWAIS